jgi:type I restriction enzyme S subunit
VSVATATWAEVSLGDICELKYGKSLPASQRKDGPVPVFGSNGQVGVHDQAATQGPAIVVGRKGSFGEVHLSRDACWPIDTTYYVDKTATKADLRWLAYRLATLGLKELNRAAAVPGLNRSDAYQKRFTLPPLAEQRRIAEVLDRADALRTKRRASIASIESLATAMFLESFGDPIQNPHGLPLCELVNLIDPKRPITYGILKPGQDDKDGVPYVRVVDMKAGGIDSTGLKRTSRAISHAYRRSLLDGGDLLMSIRGHVGRCAIVPDELRGANITQDTARLAVTGASPRYVLECLRTPAFKRWMARHTKGVAVTGINLGDVKRMPIPVPPVNDQEQFARRVTAISDLTRRVSRSFIELDALFASLQQAAFRGGL